MESFTRKKNLEKTVSWTVGGNSHAKKNDEPAKSLTQLTNHGMEDRLVDFMMCHKVSQVDLSYWQRRVDQLREEYRKREKFLNPISGTPSKPSTDEIEELVEDKLEELLKSEKFRKTCQETLNEIENSNDDSKYESEIVEGEEEIMRLSNKGYDCQKIDEKRWLMRKEINQERNDT